MKEAAITMDRRFGGFDGPATPLRTRRNQRLDDLPLAALVERAQGEDRLACEALCVRIKDRVFAYCVWICGTHNVADDLCQEALAATIQRLRHLQRSDAVLSFAFGVARNTFRKRLRTAKRGPRLVSLDAIVAPDDDRPAAPPPRDPGPLPGEPHPIEERERREAIMRDVMARESDESRRLLELYYRDRCTSADIARTLGMTESGVRMRVKRLRARLNARLVAELLEDSP